MKRIWCFTFWPLERICGMLIFFNIATKTKYGNIYVYHGRLKTDKWWQQELVVENGCFGRMEKDFSIRIGLPTFIRRFLNRRF